MSYNILDVTNALIDEILDYNYGNTETFYRIIKVLTTFPITPLEINTDFGFEEEAIMELLYKMKEEDKEDFENYKNLLKEKRGCELKL